MSRDTLCTDNILYKVLREFNQYTIMKVLEESEKQISL